MIKLSFDLKAAFDSGERAAFCRCRMWERIHFIYSKLECRVRANGTLSYQFTTRTGVHQGCFLSPFLFNFVLKMVKDRARSPGRIVALIIAPDRKHLTSYIRKTFFC